MATTQLTVQQGSTIEVSGLPVSIQIPTITPGKVIQTFKVTVTRDGSPTEYNPGQTASILPSDTVAIEYTLADQQQPVEITVDYTNTTEPTLQGT